MLTRHFRKHTKKGCVLSILLTAGLLLIPAGTKAGTNDDPGRGRLSGETVSEDFYDESPSVPLTRYGDAAGTATNPFTGKSYTHQERLADRTIINGIDVSQWQGKTIDWNKVKAAGVDFAFIRVGFRGYGDSGNLGNDLYYDINMKNAAAAGVSTGIYIFSQAITEEEAVEEANYILERIGTYAVTMPLVIDYEYAENGKTGRLYKAKLSKEEATNVCLAFCQTVAEAGYTPMVYANKSMLTDQLNAADITAKGYRIWLANYTTATDYSGDYDFWQYSDAGKVDGIFANIGKPTYVDMNFYYAQATDNFMPITSSIALATVSPISHQTYTGSAITPEVTVTYNGATLVPGQDYTVSYTDNVEPGTAFVKITGQNTFHGTKTVPFHITMTEITNFKAKKTATNYITLSWSKNSGVTGYQIYRSTSYDGEFSLLKKITSKGTTSYKNTKLTTGQCYYYKIRGYRKEGNETIYGSFSPVITAYTKASYTRNASANAGAVLNDSPSYEGILIANPPKKTVMPVIYYTKDTNGDGWYYVKYSTDEETYKGFVPAEDVTITKVGKVVNYKYVNIRKSPSTSSKLLTSLNRNKKVTILSSKKKKGETWYKVTFKKGSKTYTGWANGAYIKII